MIPPNDRRHLSREIDSLYARRVGRGGRLRANFWYLRTIAGFAVRLGRESVQRWCTGFLFDQRLVVRSLSRRKAYVLATVLTIAFGSAGVTTVYTIAHWLLLRPVPGVDAAGLVDLRLGSSESARPSWNVSHPDLLALRGGIASLGSLEASHPLDLNVALGRELSPIRLQGAVVTAGWFDTLGVSFAAGGPPSGDDGGGPTAGDAIAIEYELSRRLAATPAAALGSTVLINGSPFTVVGVTAPGFRGDRFPGEQRLWAGASSLPRLDRSVSADVYVSGGRGVWTHMVGRLRGAADATSVQAEANAVRERIVDARDRLHSFSAVHFVLQASAPLGLDPGLRGPVRRTVMLLGVAGLFLLLLALTNATNLGLAHATARGPVYSVQRALGVDAVGLVRQLLTEYLVLGLLAGAATTGLTVALAHMLRGVRLDEFGGSLSGLEIEPEVVVVTSLLAVGSALLAGIGPSVLILRSRATHSLQRGADAPRGARRVRDLLIVVQVAVSTTLLVGAALMGRTVAQLASTDVGFDADGAVVFAVDPGSQGYSGGETAELLERIEQALETTPGVTAGFVFPQPLRSSYLTSFLQRSSDPEAESVVGAHMQVAGSFLQVLGAPLLAGETDLESWSRRPADAPRTVVLSASAATALLPGTPVAQVPGRVLWQRDRERGVVPVEVAAVIGDLKINGPQYDAPPVFVWPWAQGGFDRVATGWVVARGSSTGELIGLVRTTVAAVDPNLPAFQFDTAAETLARISATQRVIAAVASGVSVLGVLLAALGLYGVLGYAVIERRREIGIRSALGARPGDLRRLVLAGGVGRVIIGLVPGLVGAVAAARWLDALLFGVTPLDPASYIGSCLFLVGAALAASWPPARWAAAVAPVEVLRRGD